MGYIRVLKGNAREGAVLSGGMKMFTPLKLFTTAFFLVVAILMSVRSSSADIYKYVDKNGTTVFTDDLRKVPEEYRGQVVIVVGQQAEGKGKLSEKMARDKKDAGQGKGKGEEGFQWKKLKRTFEGFTKGRFFMPVLGIILYLVLFFAIGKICAALEQRKLGLVLRFVLTLCVLIYLLSIT